MTTEPYPYAHRKHLAVAGVLALLALSTAVFYDWRSTPYAMVIFLMGGSTLLLAAVLLFGWTIWKDLRSRLASVVTRIFEPDTIIFRQGDPAEHVFAITQGEVELIRADATRGD